MDFDPRPVKLVRLGAGSSKTGTKRSRKRSSFTLRPRPARPLVVRASMPPVLNISIQSRITRSLRQNCCAHYPAFQSPEQGTHYRKPDVTAPIGRGLHRHPQFLQRGVLRIGLCLLMAQPPPYRKSFAIVQALFRKFLMRTALEGAVRRDGQIAPCLAFGSGVASPCRTTSPRYSEPAAKRSGGVSAPISVSIAAPSLAGSPSCWWLRASSAALVSAEPGSIFLDLDISIRHRAVVGECQ